MTAIEAASFRSKKKPARNSVKKNAELSRCSKKHQPRFFQQRPEVDHGTNADEEQQRKQLVGHSRFKQSRDGAFRIALCDCTGKRQVHQHCAKAHGQKQARFHLLCDCKVDEQRTDPPHHDHLPGQISKIGKETGECIPEIHVRSLPPYDPVAAARKKDPCHSTMSVTKVSSEHIASGISTVLTLPCSSLQGPGPADCPLLPFIVASIAEVLGPVNRFSGFFSASFPVFSGHPRRIRAFCAKQNPSSFPQRRWEHSSVPFRGVAYSSS